PTRPRVYRGRGTRRADLVGMRVRTLQVDVALMTSMMVTAAYVDARPKGRAVKHRPVAAKHASAKHATRTLPCGDYFGFQVLLDRQGFSPGQIDGKPGDNVSHALAAFQAAKRLAGNGAADCDTWRTLGGDPARPPIATYTVTGQDV